MDAYTFSMDLYLSDTKELENSCFLSLPYISDHANCFTRQKRFFTKIKCSSISPFACQMSIGELIDASFTLISLCVIQSFMIIMLVMSELLLIASKGCSKFRV